MRFLGLSIIVNARGMTKASAGIRSEQTIYAEIDLSFARIKFAAGPSGDRWMDVIGHRRPEFYDDIVRPDAYKPAG